MGSEENPIPTRRLIATITVAFALLGPWVTLGLLALKGLPPFVHDRFGQMILWVYLETGVPALAAGLLVSSLAVSVVRRSRTFHQPYDFGRCFSLGAIVGALAHGATTFLFRLLMQRRFSSFWIGGEMIAGSLTGAAILSFVLWRLSWHPLRRATL
jgi:hypothetical protein